MDLPVNDYFTARNFFRWIDFLDFSFLWNVKYFQISWWLPGMVSRDKEPCISNLFHMCPAAGVLVKSFETWEKFEKLKIPKPFLSFTPSKFANSCSFPSSTILILFFFHEDQASISSGFEVMSSIEKDKRWMKRERMMKIKSITNDYWFFIWIVTQCFGLHFLWFLIDEIGWTLQCNDFPKHFMFSDGLWFETRE